MIATPAQHGLFDWHGSGYWAESRRPLTALVFIAPLLVVYEAGVLILGPAAARNGADVWLRQLLDLVGFGQYFLLPVLTVCILLAWHYTTRQPWRVSRKTLYGMTAECVLLAMCLRLILQLQGSLLQAIAGPLAHAGGRAAIVLDVSGTVGGLIGFLGAGIYEELLFRLILLAALAWGLGRLGAGDRVSLPAGVLATSLMFAAAHYIGPCGEPLNTFSFLFRFLAGIFFGALFVYRGFGIAAGAHAGYDVLVGLFQ